MSTTLSLRPSQIDDVELKFLREQTGISDPAKLKEHVLAVQTKAYEIYGYPCIRLFSFVRLRISRLPAYVKVLNLLRERPTALCLDLGCCCAFRLNKTRMLASAHHVIVGTDVRKLATDGFPIEQLIASDLHKEFWNYGHELFQTTPETLPIKFLEGDIFDPGFMQATTSPLESPLKLDTITSLTPLAGQLSVIHASYFFHLFSEHKQLELAKILAKLLSPQPGSLILGAHTSREEQGTRTRPYRGQGDQAGEMFCHSPGSWVELWQSVFPTGSVQVDARLVKRGDPGSHPADMVAPLDVADAGVLEWSCMRL
ncbi:Methyltransferase ausD [Mycena indigotica]|uniref:Methyltransferase ausD n=1 Tax=Mycena indigotica TaxID=2126181 RepID=A0A8H6WBE3_9AGAR|nr:Methyltransferase ausD [Mycena indigotica]KAF7312539.1 Methyltransferase ausD [Mycena indigotica]